MNSESIQIAIIIPAFKRRFLAEALNSVLAQTDQRFALYICDDCSPDNLGEVVQSLIASNRYVFHKFPENLGGTSLADHWSRCVRLTSEPWVWVFSDDDVMDADCVAGFYEALEKSPPGTRVYRFNTLSIDEESQVVRVNQPHPQFEPPIQFAYHRLRGERLSFAPEYLFSREAFDQAGGFVAFPAAWGSDDASWIKFAGTSPMVTIPQGRVRWRISAENVSGQKSAGLKKVEGALGYLEWLLEWSSDSRNHALGITEEVLLQESRLWVPTQLRHLHRCLSLREIGFIAPRLARLWKASQSVLLAWLLRFNFLHLETSLRQRVREMVRTGVRGIRLIP